MRFFERPWMSSAVFTLSLAAILSGCTRPDSATTKISVAVPSSMSSQKVGAQAYDTLSHVAINVNGSGMSVPVVLSWDRNDNGNSSSTTSPTSFDIDIPQGTGRLIQVLAVYGNSTSKGQMQFYYGDVVQDLTSSAASVSVAVSSVGQGTPIISGRISGRYMTADVGGGPTSKVDMLFNPPAGKPPMIVGQGGMIAGWFQFFALGGAQLSYRMRDGTILFGGPLDLNSSALAASASVLRIATPVHQEYEYNNSTPSWVLEDPSINVMGFFGDPTYTAGKVVCKDPSGSLTKFKKSDGSVALTAVTTAQPTDLFATLLPSISLQGAVDIGGTSPCTTLPMANLPANIYRNNLFFTPPMLDNGNDSSSGFRVPFTISGTGSMVNSVRTDANTVAVTADVLPGIQVVVEKFVAYKKAGQRDSNGDFAPCINITSQGFVPAGEGALSIGSTAWAMSLPYSTSDQSSGALFALCPIYRGGIAGENGFWLRGDNLGGGGGGNPPHHVSIAIQDNLTSLGTNACVPVRFNILDSGGLSANVTTSIPYVINLGTAFVGIYSDSACTSSISTSGSFTGGSMMMAYAKATATPGVTNALSITTASLTGTNTSWTITSASITATKVGFVDQDTGNTLSTLFANRCHRILVQAQDASGIPVQISSGQFFGFSEGSFVSYFGWGTDQYCSGTATGTSGSYSVASAMTNIPASVIPLAGLTTLSGQLYSAPLNFTNTVISGGNIVAAVTGVAADITPIMNMGSNVFNATDIYVGINQCIPMEFYARGTTVGLRGQFSDIPGATFTPASFPHIQSNTGILFGSNACTGGNTDIATNTYYSAGDYRKVFFIKSTTSGTATLSVTDTVPAILKTVTVHFQ